MQKIAFDLHMGNNGLKGYYAKKCHFFTFAQELLKNGEG